MNYATYCPEDNRLRLYIGRVPRDEYEALRAEGWISTPKQDCDFVAAWTPERRDTALKYGDGVIEDEDQSPAERSIQRAERFAGYRDKREGEAVGHADRFDAGPAVYGFQSQARAERSAARHDRIGSKAVDAWSKAEYWTSRTAGVIGHALHKSLPAVRMGRIKELETAIRKAEKNRQEYAECRQMWLDCAAIAEPAKQNERAELLAGASTGSRNYQHPTPELVTNSYIKEKGSSLWTLMKMDGGKYGPTITGAEACALYLKFHGELSQEGDWLTHYRLRLAYEMQMLEADGGRAAMVEMIPGGFIGKYQIQKVNKSAATGRVVSVGILAPSQAYFGRRGQAYGEDRPGPLSIHVMNIERLPSDSYRAPTAEELAAFEADKKARKDAAPKKEVCPLINPTPEEAQKLQDLWNARARAEGEARKISHPYSYNPKLTEKLPEVCLITQATYSANSGGSYSKAETLGIGAGGELLETYDQRKYGKPVCKIRVTSGECYMPKRVIILTDKPQKALPASVWALLPVKETVNA